MIHYCIPQCLRRLSPSSQSLYLPKVNGALNNVGIQKVKKVSNNPFTPFTAPLDYYYDSVAASGDQLPWGIAATWANGEAKDTVDWTAPADAVTSGNYAWIETNDDLITAEGEYTGVEAGVSKFLLNDPTAAETFVDAFAIVIDSGVSLLDDFNIGTVSEELSMSFVDTDYDSFLFDETSITTLSDGSSGSVNNAFIDVVGHGTHVAGTIAAEADGKGVVGVAPGAEVISLKVFGDTGSTSQTQS